jgi:hypothetical protein
MGFVNKPTGNFNEHQFNWNDGDAGFVSAKKAFHVETTEAIANSGRPSTQTKRSSPYISPELKAGNQRLIRQSNISTRPALRQQPLTKNKRYTNLKICEANMVMFVNALDLDLFNANNPIISDKIELGSISDKDLASVYSFIVDNYNKKDFDPETATLIDNNGQEFEQEYNNIKMSKSDPVFPSLTEFVQQNRDAGRRALYTEILAKKGITIG